MGDQVHQGHRKRMMQRLLETGISGFQPHEVLEVLLFFIIPRRNTNQIAHELLDRFGSISGVFAASPEALRTVSGISDRSAAALRFFRELNGYLTVASAGSIQLGTSAEAGRFFAELYRLEQNEVIRAAYLDDKLRLKHCVKISEGHPSASPLLIRSVAEHAFAENSSTVILAHNHPNGSSLASQEDIAATQMLYTTLRNCGVELIDHVIIGTDGATFLRESGAFLGME